MSRIPCKPFASQSHQLSSLRNLSFNPRGEDIEDYSFLHSGHLPSLISLKLKLLTHRTHQSFLLCFAQIGSQIRFLYLCVDKGDPSPIISACTHLKHLCLDIPNFTGSSSNNGLSSVPTSLSSFTTTLVAIQSAFKGIRMALAASLSDVQLYLIPRRHVGCRKIPLKRLTYSRRALPGHVENITRGGSGQSLGVITHEYKLGGCW